MVALMLAVRFRRDHSGCATRVQFVREPVRIEGLVCHNCAERGIPDPRRNTFHVVRLTRQQQKADQVAKRIDQGNDFGPQTAARAAGCLSLSPSFAPVAPW